MTTKSKVLDWAKASDKQKKRWLKIDKSVAKPKKSSGHLFGPKGMKFIKELEAHKADRRFW